MLLNITSLQSTPAAIDCDTIFIRLTWNPSENDPSLSSLIHQNVIVIFHHWRF